jgi:hypothetical protein
MRAFVRLAIDVPLVLVGRDGGCLPARRNRTETVARTLTEPLDVRLVLSQIF